MKPDPRIFAAVAARLPVEPARVLFLDDNAVNVEAGAAAGYVSRHVRGLAEVEQALVAVGIGRLTGVRRLSGWAPGTAGVPTCRPWSPTVR